MATCNGTTAKGDACTLDAQPDSEFCRFHGEDEEDTQDPPAEVLEESAQGGPDETTVEGPSEPRQARKERVRHGEYGDGEWHCTETLRSGKTCTTRYGADQVIAQRNHLKRVHKLKA